MTMVLVYFIGLVLGAFVALTTSMFWFWVAVILIAVLSLLFYNADERIFLEYYKRGYRNGIERMYEILREKKKE